VTVIAFGGVTAGLLGFLVVLALVIAAVFLFRSMLHHMRKVPASFDEPPAEDVTRPESPRGGV
jgi:hypothetical protein